MKLNWDWYDMGGKWDWYDMEGKPHPIEEWNAMYPRTKGAFNMPSTRHVGYTKIGRVVISTVLLGLDHGFSAGSPPVIFETMVFGLKSENSADEVCVRYHTLGEAALGHLEMCEAVQRDLDAEAAEKAKTYNPLAGQPEPLPEMLGLSAWLPTTDEGGETK